MPTTRIRATPTPTQKTRASALARTLDPVSGEEFLAEHWEQKPLVVPRGEQGRFDDLLSVADVERLLTSGGLRFPGFRLAKAGAKLEVSDYTKDLSWRPQPFTGTADVERVLAEFEDGATIVLQGLHLNWRPLAEFCRSLEGELGHPAQANAYFTPRSAQGLPVHHDTHDVFSLQVAGEKRWLVYEPAWELPLKHQRYKAETMGEPGEPVLDVTLQAGDTLYLPRGWLHEAKTSETDSLHLTVGVNVYTWMDAFRAALDSCAGEVGFRRSPDDDGADDLLELLAEQLQPGAGRAPPQKEARAFAPADPRRAAEPAARARGPRPGHRRRTEADRPLRPRGHDALLRGQGHRLPATRRPRSSPSRAAPTSRSHPANSPASWTTRGASCSFAGSSAKGFS